MMIDKKYQLQINREQLADILHKQWSGWMRYLFVKGTFNDDGTWTMPAWAVERWQRQMNTPYKNLPANEQETDLIEADQVFEMISQLSSTNSKRSVS